MFAEILETLRDIPLWVWLLFVMSALAVLEGSRWALGKKKDGRRADFDRLMEAIKAGDAKGSSELLAKYKADSEFCSKAHVARLIKEELDRIKEALDNNKAKSNGEKESHVSATIVISRLGEQASAENVPTVLN